MQEREVLDDRDNPLLLLLVPPTTLPNSPYSATPHLTGYLRSRGINVAQYDVGLQLLLTIFSDSGLRRLRSALAETIVDGPADPIVREALEQFEWFLRVIEPTICFLQGRDPTLALRIANGGFFPPTHYGNLFDREATCRRLGMEACARIEAGRFIERIADLITRALDPKFTMNGYGSQVVSKAPSFSAIEEYLQAPPSLIGCIVAELVESLMLTFRPAVIGLTAPFPGTLYGAFEIAKCVRTHSKETSLVLGGAYVSTELRSLAEPRVFDYFDYVVLDDGYLPLLAIYDEATRKRREMSVEPTGKRKLYRTFVRDQEEVRFSSSVEDGHLRHAASSTPTYQGLQLDSYFSCMTRPNIMDQLWSGWCWNHIIVSHGCYWKKCSFCDVQLDYVKRYEVIPESQVVDRIVAILEETQHTGFHFVDEALPPSVLAKLAEELLRRHVSISWWGNIRFEKAFSPSLAELLARSGCVAVTGGLEAPCDRLLKSMGKGVSVAQAARTAHAFRSAGVVVHAYLMYGLPSESVVETIDGLEIVRQLFSEGLINNGHWHRFSLTAYSPIGQAPESFGIKIRRPTQQRFAALELEMSDESGLDHTILGVGLQRAVDQYKIGVDLNRDVREWFDCDVPATTIPADYVRTLVDAQL